jgi:tRNA modification GTPase
LTRAASVATLVSKKFFTMSPLDDTIAAIATPPGEGGIAVVRVSGPGTGRIARSLLPHVNGDRFVSGFRAFHVTRIEDPSTGRPLDEVLALWMPGPASYTREDVLEIQCHGGHAAARAVLEAALEAGARLAEPGEFTLRAYLRGRIDLIQAEAVLDVIRARTDASLAVHERLLEGRLSADVEDWQQRLGRALALLEAHLDFPEDDIGDLDADSVRADVASVITSMEEKLGTFAWGRAARDGFTAALVGSPNTGKSSLLNSLLGEDRAIVSATPGTTRDFIDAWVNARGVPVRLIDTAGLGTPTDFVEQEGVRRARRSADQADVVLLVCDGSRPLSAAERDEARRLAKLGGALPVVNKRDLGSEPAECLVEIFARPPLTVSARTGEGLADLLDALRDAAWQGDGPTPEVPLTRARHRSTVESALGCLERAANILAEGGFLELAASEIHAARRHLAELLGWGSPEDVLDAIFSEFCIGK